MALVGCFVTPHPPIIVPEVGGESLAQVEATVRRVVTERYTDGQLRDSGLTPRDLEALQDAFARMLISMYHPRVEYPEPSTRSGHADLRHQPSGA
jgi:hypothetical protein